MSDENMNINDEEADLLFVSAKKKKQAEDEAKKRAAEEQAKREAAEAAILQMEKEVEERRKKAEEEKKALEESAKNPAPAPAVAAAPETRKPKEKVKKEFKMPAIPKMAYIIAAAVVVIAVAVILIVVNRGKKGSDIEDIKFDAEYQVPDSKVVIKYPKEEFEGEITKIESEGNSEMFLIGENKRAKVEMSVTPLMDGDDKVSKTSVDAIFAAASLGELSISSTELGESLEEFSKKDEKIPDVVNSPKDSVYSCTFGYEKKKSGKVASWIIPDEEGNLNVIVCVVYENEEEPDYSAKLCDLFVENNSQNMILGVGANPPTATDMDGMLKIDLGHMGIPIPLHSFEEIAFEENVHYYADSNGAMIMVFGSPFDGEPSTDMVKANRDSLVSSFEIASKEMLGGLLGDKVSDRQNTSQHAYDPSEKVAAYEADYSINFKSVPYWERDFICAWRDTREDVWYSQYIIMFSPAKNRDVYQPMFEKSIANLADI